MVLSSVDFSEEAMCFIYEAANLWDDELYLEYRISEGMLYPAVKGATA